MRRDWPNAVVSGTPAKAGDIEDLQDEINRVRTEVGLAPVSWPSVYVIRAADLEEMRDAVQEVWTEQGLGSLPDWSGHAPEPGVTDLALHVMDLRVWVSRSADYPPIQAVDSFSYTPVDPFQTQWAVIDSAWPTNITGLTSTAPTENKVKSVRCKIVAKRDGASGQRVILSSDDESITRFTNAFSEYHSSSDLEIYAVLNSETYYRGEIINAELGDVIRNGEVIKNTNEYIENFSDEAKRLYLEFADAGVTHYIIWNEPNDSETLLLKHLDAPVFAALLRRCWQKMVPADPSEARPFLYWGGILFTDVGGSLAPHSGQTDYLADVYQHVDAQLSQDPEALRNIRRDFPWDGINVHIHHIPYFQDTHDSFCHRLFVDHIWPTQEQYGDSSAILVGEWGVTRKNLTDDGAALQKAFDRIRPWPTMMIYFTHPDFDQSGSGNPADWWGLVNRTASGGAWVTSTDTPQGTAYRAAL